MTEKIEVTKLDTPYISLLNDIIVLRNEIQMAQRDLMPVVDPTGDARLAYQVCADQMTTLIKIHQVRNHKEIGA